MPAAEATAGLEVLLDAAPAAAPAWPVQGGGDLSPLFKQVPPAVQERRDDNWLAAHVGRVRPDPFAVLYERYWRRIAAFCMSIVGTREEAEDAAQEAMARAYSVLSARREQPDFRPWIHAIARNAALDRLRQRNRGPELGLADDELLQGYAEDPEAILGRREQVERLFADLTELSERQRAALVLRELSGLSHEEIALALDTTAERSRSLVAEARNALTGRRDGRAIACGEYRRAVDDSGGRIPRGQRMRAHRDSCPSCQASARPRLLSGLLFPLPLLERLFGSATAKAAALAGGSKVATGAAIVAVVAAGGTTASGLPGDEPAKRIAGTPVVAKAPAPERAAVLPAADAPHARPAKRSGAADAERPRARAEAPPAPAHQTSPAPAIDVPVTGDAVGGRMEETVDRLTAGRHPGTRERLRLPQVVTDALPQVPGVPGQLDDLVNSGAEAIR